MNYCYVVAVNDNPTYVSAPSNIACATTLAFPAPANVTVSTNQTTYSGKKAILTPLQGSAVISWGPLAVTTSTLSVKGISVERSTNSTTGFVQVVSDTSSALLPNGSTWSEVDSTAPAATKLFYRLRYILSDGSYSQYSNVVSVTSLTPSQPSLKVSLSKTAGVVLSWKDNDKGVQSFNVLLSSGTTTLASVPGSVTTYTDTTTVLYPSSSYCYVVQAVFNLVNNISSPAECVTTGKAAAPSGLKASILGGQVSLTWSVGSSDGFSGVSVERSPVKTSGFGQVGVATNTTYVDSGLPFSTTYYYRVRLAYSNGSYGPYSKVLTAKTGSTAVSAKVLVNTEIDTTTVDTTATTTASTSATVSAATPISPTATTATPIVVDQSVSADVATTADMSSASVSTAGAITTPSSMATMSPQTNPPHPISPAAPSVTATRTYTCPTGSTLSGTQCTASVLSTTGGVNASKSTTCPEGYSETANLCRNRTTQATTAKVVTYTCKTGLTLNTADNKCYKTTQTSTPAIPTYSCPTSYTLDATAHTCSQVVSSAFATSTTTADVWNAIGGWFGWLGDWFK